MCQRSPAAWMTCCTQAAHSVSVGNTGRTCDIDVHVVCDVVGMVTSQPWNPPAANVVVVPFSFAAASAHDDVSISTSLKAHPTCPRDQGTLSVHFQRRVHGRRSGRARTCISELPDGLANGRVIRLQVQQILFSLGNVYLSNRLMCGTYWCVADTHATRRSAPILHQAHPCCNASYSPHPA